MDMTMTTSDTFDETENINTIPLERRLGRMIRRTRSKGLVEIQGATFGRSIVKSISDLEKDHLSYMINIRNRKCAVVLGLDEYDALIALREAASELTSKYTELKLKVDGDRFDQAFAKMQSKEAKASVQDFFDMEEDSIDLAGTFKAGETENK